MADGESGPKVQTQEVCPRCRPIIFPVAGAATWSSLPDVGLWRESVARTPGVMLEGPGLEPVRVEGVEGNW